MQNRTSRFFNTILLMTVRQLHTGLDLHLQQINSNLNDNVSPEAKDYYLNQVTKMMLRSAIRKLAADDSPNSSYNSIPQLTSEELTHLTDFIKNYIVTKDIVPFVVENSTNSAYKGYLNISNINNPILSGYIENGKIYKIITLGTTNFDNFFEPETAYSTFSADRAYTASLTFSDSALALSKINIVANNRYRILKPLPLGTWQSYGASSDIIGTEFTATTTVEIVADSDSLYIVKAIPAWSGGTKIKEVKSDGIFATLGVTAMTKTKTRSKNCTKNNTYLISGTPTSNLNSYGYYNSLTGIFIPYADIDLTNIVQDVYFVRTVPCLIASPRDIDNLSYSSFTKNGDLLIAEIDSSTISVISKVDPIVSITYKYLKNPIEISHKSNITSDLPEAFHDLLVTNTANFIASRISDPDLQSMLLFDREIRKP